ncbi:hypothetical protein AVEN_53647-1, partial [Araneus ventricosus]
MLNSHGACRSSDSRFGQTTRRGSGTTVRIQPTTVHKYEPRATRGLAKPRAVGTA